MIIGSKLPPIHSDNTYFNLGRSAFAFLISEVIQPKKVYLPSFTCWSLVSTMELKFPDIEIEFYPVDRNLYCFYPNKVRENEVLVFIHFFGKENKISLPDSNGVILEDISHAIASKINYRGDYIFGSLRKSFKIADGGIIKSYFNPIYEPSKKLDTWLRYEAQDWKDMREAENMIDRKWETSDISSKSLEIFLTSNLDTSRLIRQKNDKFLYDNLSIGRPLITFEKNEAPLVHNRVFDSTNARNSLKKHLALKGIFTSIHWPTHDLVKSRAKSIEDTLWLESHILSFPISQDLNQNDMEYIVENVNDWKNNV